MPLIAEGENSRHTSSYVTCLNRVETSITYISASLATSAVSDVDSAQTARSRTVQL